MSASTTTHETTVSDPIRDALPIATNRQSFAFALSRLRQYPGRLILATLCFVLAGVCGLVPPLLLGWLVDHWTAGTLSASQVWTAALACAAAGLLGGLALWLGWRSLSVATEAVVADLRESAVRKGLAVDAAVVEQAGTGDLVSRVAEDSRLVADTSAQLLPWMINSLVAVVVTSVGLLALDWRLGLVGLVAVPLYALSLRWYLPRSAPIYTAERAAFAVRAGHLLGGIHGARTLRAFGAEQTELDRINASSAQARDLSINVFRLLTRFFGRNNRAEAITLGLILAAGFVFASAGWVSAGQVSAAALLFHRLFNPLGMLVTIFDDIQSALASLTRLVGVIAAPVPDRRAPVPATAPQALTARSLSHSYLAGQPVLRAVDLRIGAGEVVALVGSTGAGKSTLAAAMAGNLTPADGVVDLDSTDVRQLPEAELRRRICLVSQEVHTFSGSLREDLLLARPEADDAEVWAALAEVRADGWVRELPEGLDTRVGDGGHRLSAVRAQQLALARVIIADPAFVILDEATAEAGSSGSRDLDEAARATIAGRGALVVAHRLSQAAIADRIVVLEHGRIVESGGHDALVEAGGRYAELWRAWAG